MSHIPEDELHAYLDQAMGRAQCVVIESHLAGCAECRALRDAIAALRDQTTLLLGRAAPARRIPPSFEEIRRRAAPAPVTPRARLVRRSAMAASLIGALGIGYAIRSFDAPRPAQSMEAAPPARMPVSDPARDDASLEAPRIASGPGNRGAPQGAVLPAASQDAAVPAALAVPDIVAPPTSIEMSTDTLPSEDDARLEGLWRTVPWDGVQAAAGREPSRIMGVPVQEVQVQPSRQEGGKPVTVVAQRLSSGEVIQTIEGPAADVSELLSRRGDGGIDSAGRPAEAVRSGDRMIVVTGQLPSDSLRALVRRVNAAMRVR